MNSLDIMRSANVSVGSGMGDNVLKPAFMPARGSIDGAKSRGSIGSTEERKSVDFDTIESSKKVNKRLDSLG